MNNKRQVEGELGQEVKIDICRFSVNVNLSNVS